MLQMLLLGADEPVVKPQKNNIKKMVQMGGDEPVVEPGQELGEPPQAVQVFLETLPAKR